MFYLNGTSLTVNNSGVTSNNYGLVANSAGASINNSSIFGNSNYEVFSSLASPLLDATNNWWGAMSGPYNATSNPGGAGDHVSNGVSYTPYLTQASLTCS